MTGQNDRQDESLTGQVHDQAGHCPLTGRYFEPWPNMPDIMDKAFEAWTRHLKQGSQLAPYLAQYPLK